MWNIVLTQKWKIFEWVLARIRSRNRWKGLSSFCHRRKQSARKMIWINLTFQLIYFVLTWTLLVIPVGQQINFFITKTDMQILGMQISTDNFGNAWAKKMKVKEIAIKTSLASYLSWVHESKVRKIYNCKPFSYTLRILSESWALNTWYTPVKYQDFSSNENWYQVKLRFLSFIAWFFSFYPF